MSRAASTYLEVLEAPYLGLDTISGPLQVAKGYSPHLVNVLTGRPGSLPMRGGMHRVIELPKAYTAAWAARTSAVLLSAAGDTALMQVNAANWTLSELMVASADHVPDVPYAEVGAAVYGIGRNGHLLRLSSNAITKYTNAPTGGVDIAYWKNRLWYLAGTSVDGAATGKDRVYWSDLVAGNPPLPDAVTSWQDDVSGLTNQLVLGTIGDANEPVGYGTLSNGIIVFGSKTADMFVGNSPSNIVLRAGVLGRGCVDKRTIISTGDVVMWLAPEGFFAYDGAQEVDLSGRISNTLQNMAAAVKAAGGTASATMLPNNYVLLMSSVAYNGQNAWLLHVPTSTWSYFRSPAIETYGFVGAQGAGGGHGFTCSGPAIWDLDNVTQALNMFGMFGREPLPSGGAVPLTATVRHRSRALASMMDKAQILRLGTDSLGGSQVSIVDDNDAPLLQKGLPQDVPGKRERFITDTYMETNEAIVEVLLGTDDGGPAELYDGYLEYQPAQQTTSY